MTLPKRVSLSNRVKIPSRSNAYIYIYTHTVNENVAQTMSVAFHLNGNASWGATRDLRFDSWSHWGRKRGLVYINLIFKGKKKASNL